MFRRTLRFAVPILMLGGGIAALTVPASGRQIVIQGRAAVPAAAKDDDAGKAKAASVEVMTFPSDRDAKNMIQAVKDYMKEFKDNEAKAPWDKICQAAQQVLDAKSDSFFELPKASPDAPQGRVSAKAEINRLIGEFPQAGRQFYQLAYGAPAENLFAKARESFDREMLADVSQRYFHTKAGAAATLLLAGIHLERGNYVEAAYNYNRLLARPDSDDIWTPLNRFKALVALRRAGTSEQSESFRQLLDQFERKFPRDGLVIGNRNFTLDELREELDRRAESLFGKVSEAFVAMRYGTPSHTALLEGGKPFLDPLWGQSVFRRRTFKADTPHQGNQWVIQNLEDVLKSINFDKQEVAISGFFPATAQNLLFFRSYDGIYCYVTKDGFLKLGQPSRAGELNWFAPLEGATASLIQQGTFSGTLPVSEGFRKEDLDRYWRYYRDQGQLKSILFENPLVGTLAHDGRAVYAVDDAGLPPPPPNQYDEFNAFAPGNAQPQPATGQARGFQDGNYLVAIDIQTGHLLWRIGKQATEKPLTEQEEDESTNTLHLMQGSFFLGPPLPLNGKLYVLYERNGVIRLACLDPQQVLTCKVPHQTRDENDRPMQIMVQASYPALVWNQRLGEPNARLPTDTLRRFQGSYLAFADGVMVCPTNAGAVVAVDVMNRSLKWARSYRTLKTGSEEGGGPGGRINRRLILPGGGGNVVSSGGMSPFGKDRWRAAAPIISEGRVVFAAFDSDAIYCLDLHSGDVLWKESQKPGDLYIGGLMNGKIIIVGKDSMRAIQLKGNPREVRGSDSREDVVYAWRDLTIPLPAGHGAPCKDGTYYLPVVSSPDDPNSQVWAIDTEKGEVVAKAAYRKKDLSEGKPMLGNLIFHENQLYSQSATEVTAFPLIDLKKAEMNRLLAADPNDPVGLVARGELLLDEGKLSEAIRDFANARKNDPPEAANARLRDKLFVAYTELLRRDFSEGEAFLNEYKQLCNLAAESDDPNERLKQMEERDRRQRLYLELLAKGRESQGRFAEAFDAYRDFASYGGNKELVSLSDEPNGRTRPDLWARGRIEAMIRKADTEDARTALGDLVKREWDKARTGDLQTLRDFVTIFGQHFATGRQAELLLGEQLIALDTPDANREAQAVLGRLAATAEEDDLAARAIEHLAVMATKRGQPETAVNFFRMLGTRYATVELRPGVRGADLLNDLLTDKRLLPHLEPARLPTPARVKAEQERLQAYNYQLAGMLIEPEGGDREPFFQRHRIVLNNTDGGGTWTLRVTDRGSGAEKWKHSGLQFDNPTGLINYRIARARGNLLLMHLGHEVHCLDLAEQKHVWKFPVFGEGQTFQPDRNRTEVSTDEDMFVAYGTDGTKISIGRSTILETNYAALITRDGLVAIDPVSGSRLWTRTNIASSSLIFGDARYVFVVETVGGKKTSRVLRAIDGTPVQDVPDFSSIATGSNRVRILGRHLLIAEGGRLKPLVVRLHDPLVGKDVWNREYAPVPEPEDYKARGLEFNGNARLMKSLAQEYIGVLQRDGKIEVLNIHSGERVFQAAVDPNYVETHVASAGNPTLLADDDRFYILLNKTADPANRNNIIYSYNNMQLRTIPVSGPVYCYEKATGRRAWFADKLFENQQLIVERFAELPALVLATYVTEEDENGVAVVGRNRGAGNMVYRVVVVDKVNGKARMVQNLSQGGHSTFYGVETDPRTGSAVLYRGDVNIRISEDTGEPGLAASNSAATGTLPPQK